MSNIKVEKDTIKITDFEVASKPLAKLLEPLDEKDRETLLSDLIRAAANGFARVETDAELRVMQTAAATMSEALEANGAKSVESVQKLLDDQINEQNPRSFYNLVRTRLTQAVADDLSLENDNSPLKIIFGQLQKILAKEEQDASAADVYSKSREKGLDFEQSVHSLIESVAEIHGDSAEFVGNTKNEKGDKEGDSLVKFGTPNPLVGEFRLVWESKTEKDFKDSQGRIKRTKARQELDAALNTRDAHCAILVVDDRGIDLDIQPEFQMFDGNKLNLVINQEKPDIRLIRLAYLWAKNYEAKLRPLSERTFDVEAIDRQIAQMEDLRQAIINTKGGHTAIKTGLETATKNLERLETEFFGGLEAIQALINPNGISEE